MISSVTQFQHYTLHNQKHIRLRLRFHLRSIIIYSDYMHEIGFDNMEN